MTIDEKLKDYQELTNLYSKGIQIEWPLDYEYQIGYRRGFDMGYKKGKEEEGSNWKVYFDKLLKAVKVNNKMSTD